MSFAQRKIDWTCLLLLAAPAALAQSLQPLDSIRDAAAAHVRRQMTDSPTPGVTLHAEAGALDPRLRLPLCARKPTAFNPAGELRPVSRQTVGVRCDQPAWTVYVPVVIESELPVLVLRRAATRGAVILPQDVESQRRRVPGVAENYITDVSQLTERHLRNAAAPGTALTVELLAADLLIRRGQRVTLIASVGGLEVRAQGEAVADAQPDGRVRVLNLTSRRIVEGQVESRDSVRVRL